MQAVIHAKHKILDLAACPALNRSKGLKFTINKNDNDPTQQFFCNNFHELMSTKSRQVRPFYCPFYPQCGRKWQLISMIIMCNEKATRRLNLGVILR